MPPSQDLREFSKGTLRRELWLYSVYRALEALMFGLLVLGPTNDLIGGYLLHPELALVVLALYLPFSAAMILWSRSERHSVAQQVLAGTIVDILIANLFVYALPSATAPVALMLMLNVGAAALLMSLRLGIAAAALASITFLLNYAIGSATGAFPPGPLAEPVMFSISFFAITVITHQIGKHMQEADSTAVKHAEELADLAQVNELIIRRMRTGVLLVDREANIRLANEASMLLLGEGASGTTSLAEAAPELALRLSEWLRNGLGNDTPLRLGGEQFEVVPRFVRLLANSDHVLIFLDDTSLVSRRAESLTLAAMGRFSASLAHEIRNPLAAISYAAQLLEESKDLPAIDRQMVEIILKQCQRTNIIVESVLGLARRERATAEHVELVGFLRNFIEELGQSSPDEIKNITLATSQPLVPALVDPRHLHQVVTSMVQNARRHGHLPGEPARITLHAYRLNETPVVDIIDRGPGIPEAVVPQLFRPFFTTSEHGTGLGLYIARELCRANGASLDYVPLPGGGCCFRITMPGQHSLLPA